MGVIRRAGMFVLQVNPILCDGFGHCAELAPELVHLDEWGYPIIASDPVPMADVGSYQSARYAERGCPRQALHVAKVATPVPITNVDVRPPTTVSRGRRPL
ncbi:MAG: ferredoxin [Acidobacteria bacterium]|nr:ferredoxin [Acidobacteriota bacterium]